MVVPTRKRGVLRVGNSSRIHASAHRSVFSIAGQFGKRRASVLVDDCLNNAFENPSGVIHHMERGRRADRLGKWTPPQSLFLANGTLFMVNKV